MNINGKSQPSFQIYTTAFQKLRRKLPCLDPHEDQKPGISCLCYNCGMLAILIESTKRPAVPHTPEPKKASEESSYRRERRRIDLQGKSNSEIHLINMMHEMGMKISWLENRLMEHEAQMIHKDYFRIVMRRLEDKFSNTINDLIQKIDRFENRNVKTYYPVNIEDNKLPDNLRMEEGPSRKISRITFSSEDVHDENGWKKNDDKYGEAGGSNFSASKLGSIENGWKKMDDKYGEEGGSIFSTSHSGFIENDWKKMDDKYGEEEGSNFSTSNSGSIENGSNIFEVDELNVFYFNPVYNK